MANLQIELAAVVDCGQSFVKATYNLKGDGAVVFNCYEILDVLSKGVQTAHFPNLHAVAQKTVSYAVHIRWICHYAYWEVMHSTWAGLLCAGVSAEIK